MSQARLAAWLPGGVFFSTVKAPETRVGDSVSEVETLLLSACGGGWRITSRLRVLSLKGKVSSTRLTLASAWQAHS